MRMKKVTAMLMIFTLLFSSVCLHSFAVEDIPQESVKLDINAKSAILMEPETGTVLYSLNPDEKLHAASVTKVMTILLVAEAIENGKLDFSDQVTASKYAVSMGGSQIWLKEGEVMTVDELLKATCVASANDAAVALGEKVAGSNDAFVEMMNKRAKELGMTNTVYKNATGLDDTDDDHLTSARDIAIVSSELMKHEFIKDYTLIWMDYLRDGKTELVNTNKLIKRYQGITGLKTGTTSKAGSCLSATAERDGMKLVAVVLGAPKSDDRFNAATTMLDYGFSNYETVKPAFDCEMLEPIKVTGGMCSNVKLTANIDRKLIVPKGRGSDIVVEIDIADSIAAPVESGVNVGSVRLTLDGAIVGEYPVYTDGAAEKIKTSRIFKKLIGCIFGF